MELRDQVAIVAGAAGAVGGAVARRFAAEGARLVLADEDEDALAQAEEALRGAATPFESVKIDLAAESQIHGLVERALDRFGRIDILVHAMAASDDPPWDEPGPASWERRLRSLTSCALCCRSVEPAMRARGRGRIVNVAATAGRYRSAYFRPEGASGTAEAYAAASGGVLALTRELALELGPHGITVNAVVPGWILTERSAREWNGLADNVRRNILAEISLGRPGRPEEVAGAVLFLASDASIYVSGTSLDINGGWWMS
jgi:3-oxoacyl-[acyl-carrier protein] reductase